MMTSLWIVQSIDARGADVVQYVLSAGIIAAVSLLVKMALDVVKIKTVLMNPDNGVIREIGKLRDFSHDYANLLLSHAYAINRAEEAAGLQPTEGLQPKRRTDLNAG